MSRLFASLLVVGFFLGCSDSPALPGSGDLDLAGLDLPFDGLEVRDLTDSAAPVDAPRDGSSMDAIP